ncbi:hypothetical protein K437DRAFT_259560 [Tilletiaria anomala UBC 951]|uniref:Uncharacterized protein n=1 Tax=Tilletiaria anomala (strain ATCC 24038 / CBS 436.72 / UBC 951) TaxID=1037660 RepID=A0A066V8B8_TILAU|nr:uncharacterized protein K437DRAFT_259560 [Tilletiaria anomala UBC 951]KDN37977.1 hypothetical protein K437DRAFT_259560 [Tilletiaria anomala UBC 951]
MSAEKRGEPRARRARALLPADAPPPAINARRRASRALPRSPRASHHQIARRSGEVARSVRFLQHGVGQQAQAASSGSDNISLGHDERLVRCRCDTRAAECLENVSHCTLLWCRRCFS